MFPSLDFFLAPESAIVLSLLFTITVAFIRMRNGGEFLDETKLVADSIAGMVLIILTLLWYGVVFDHSILVLWVTKPLGKVAVSSAFFYVWVSRLKVVLASCTNKNGNDDK